MPSTVYWRLGVVEKELRELRLEFQKYREDESARRKDEARESKVDRRWRVGTSLTVVMAILAAAGIIANAL